MLTKSASFATFESLFNNGTRIEWQEINNG